MPAGLVGAGPRVMNWQSGFRNQISLVAGGPDIGCHRCRRLGSAVVADDAVPAGRCFRVRPFLGAAESLVARAPVLRAVDRKLHRDGSIDRKVKRTAIIVILITPVITWLFGAPLWIIAGQIAVLSAATMFILTRPLPRER